MSQIADLNHEDLAAYAAHRFVPDPNLPLPEYGPYAATFYVGSDCNPASVIYRDGKYVTVQSDDWKIVSGSEQDGSARYEYFANPDGASYVFRLNAKGRYEGVVKNPLTGRWVKAGYGNLSVGHRRRYYDPHF